MTLKTFMETCTTTKMSVTISDSTGDIITFNSEGYAGVESDVLAREVKSWGISNQKTLNVVIADIVKPAGTITLSKDNVSLESVGATDTVTVTEATGAVSAVSSDEEVATVSVEGTTITIEEVSEGTATITVKSAETSEYQEATADIEVICTAL